MSPYTTELIHLEDIEPRTGLAAKWQRMRHRRAHWLAEMAAEAFGAFLYCYCGGSCAAAFIFGTLAGLQGVGSLFGAGLGYAIGVVLALVVCSATSGGHFNPCMTIVFMLFKKFPPLKGLRYIIAQIFGAYVAFGFIYAQYRPTILAVEAALQAKKVYDEIMFTATGPGGAFGLYAPTGYGMGTIFLNEFIVDFTIATVIFACVDPTNLLVPPSSAPWIIGLTYGVAIWGFVPNGLAANSARDLGGRLMAITIWGTKAAGGRYAAIAALTNIPATILAALFYEFVFADSLRVVNPAQKLFRDAHLAHGNRLTNAQNGHEEESIAAGSTEKV